MFAEKGVTLSGLENFRLPDVGEGLTEAEIVRWRVTPGARINVNDALVDIETSKSVVELTSPFAGVVEHLLVAEGDTVPVGTPLVSVRGVATGDSQEVLVGRGPSPLVATRRPRRSQPGLASIADVSSEAGAPSARVKGKATPPTRLLAKTLSVDLDAVKGSGPEGRILRRDVEHHAARSVAAIKEPQQRVLRTPIRGVRKHTAEAMVVSAFTAPHVTEWLTIDATRSLKLLKRARRDRAFAGVKLTPLLLIMRATLVALARHPEMNASWNGDAGEIIQFADVNLGIATSTPRGLIVPNIKSAQSISTQELASGLQDLVATARAGTTSLQDMSGGTFTITNIGVFGVDGGTPILKPGEAGILCVGRIGKTPWAHKGRVRLRSTVTLALTFDHRVVDGELGSRVLACVGGLLEHPEMALVG